MYKALMDNGSSLRGKKELTLLDSNYLPPWGSISSYWMQCPVVLIKLQTDTLDQTCM